MKAEEYVKIIEQQTNRNHSFSHFQKFILDEKLNLKKIKYIHVGGTNGKGSCVNYIRAILERGGYQVGTFTSPYLKVHYDRIRIQNKNISQGDFKAICDEHFTKWIDHKLSMFEMDTCIALQYFNMHNVDFAIIEVGIGGRYDATNVITPLISVITSIGKDHQEILGNTYEAITVQKAGIIKPGSICVYNEHKKRCVEVIEKYSRDTKIIQVNVPKNAYIIHNKWTFELNNVQYSIKSLAKYQIENACTAITTIKALTPFLNNQIDDQEINLALMNCEWPGRYEILNQKPLFLIDGAHNVHGISALVNSLPTNKYTVVFSVLSDKNFPQMLKKLRKISDNIIVTNFNHKRSVSLDNAFIDHQYVHYSEDYERIIDTALANKEPLIITGSLYFISIVRAKYLNYFIR